MLTTSDITVTLLSPSNSSISGARITATLTQMDTAALSGMVFPREVEATTDENGQATLGLWPNTEGVTGSQYRFRARHPTTGRKLLDELVTVPAHDANLRDLLLLPAPTKKPYDEASITAIQQARAEAVIEAGKAIAAAEGLDEAKTAAVEAKDQAQSAEWETKIVAQAVAQDKAATYLLAQQASTSEQTAGQHKTAAQQAATQAAGDRQTAQGAATTATEKADLAGQHKAAAESAAQQAATSRQGVEDLRDQAAQSAHDAGLAQGHASQAMHQANLSAVNASIYKNLSNNYAQQSQEHRDKAQTFRESARRWAQEGEDVPVLNEDGEVPQYSAMHWAIKAERFALEGGIRDDLISLNSTWSSTKLQGEISQLQQNINSEAQARQDADDAIQLQITSLENYAENIYFKKEGGHIGGSVSIAGNLTVQGETVQVDSQISTADRLIIVNSGEVGAGVTGGFAGLEVDRGTSDAYEFGFNEGSGYFELGKQGGRQPAMTREVAPADGKVLKWNAANKRAEASDLTWAEVTEKPDLATQQQFSSLLTGLKDSFVSGKQSIDAVS